MGVVLQGSVCKVRQETPLTELRRLVLEAAQFNTGVGRFAIISDHHRVVKFSTSERLLRKQSIELEIRSASLSSAQTYRISQLRLTM